MKRILKLLLVLSVGFCGFIGGTSLIEHYAVQKAPQLVPYNSIVTSEKNTYGSIIRLEHGDFGFYCTAVVIDGNYALTAAHCLNNEIGLMSDREIVIYDQNQTYTGVKAKAAAVDNTRDIGFIQGDFRDFEAAKVDFTGEDIKVGMVMTACGFPSGQFIKFCVDLVLYGNYQFRYRTQGPPIFRGMSGGPVVASNGHVVGINSAVDNNSVIIAPLVGVLEILGL